MEYWLRIQRLSTGEHMVSAYPATGTLDILHHTYSSWGQFKATFSKWVDEAEMEALDSTLSKSSFGVDVYKDRRVVTRSILDDLGFR